MHRLPFETPPRWWESKMNPFVVRLFKPLRNRRLARRMKVVEVELRGEQHLASLLEQDVGVLIAPNHAGDGDVESLSEAADRLGKPWHFMAAWQVFKENGPIGAYIMQLHGAFSIDREGTDMRAFRHSVELLQQHDCPLSIFPEGEVYYTNDRIRPFRQGPAAIALTAARRGERPIKVLPAAVKFFFVDDPTAKLEETMDLLEKAIYWRVRKGPPLMERIYRFAEAPLALKELEYLGHTRSGALPERICHLMEAILQQVEEKYELPRSDEKLPERLKRSRQQAIAGVEASDDDAERQQHANALDDLFLVAQLFSYPGDYLAEKPSIERIADTMKKFEEDVLDRVRPEPPANRRVVIEFGEPIDAPKEKRAISAADLTLQMEDAVQSLLDGIEK